MSEPALHPLNRGFTWQRAPGPLRRLTPAQADAYHERGFFVLEDALAPDALARVVAAIDPVEARTEAFLRTREGGRLFIARAGEITFTPHLVAGSEALRAFCGGPLFQDLCHDLIGPDARLYWEQSVYKKPGAVDEFPWHQDNGYTFIEPQQYLTCWIALTDTDEGNGCPWVVPGLHLRGTLRHWMTDLGWCCLERAEGAVPVPARAGSIVVFSSLTPHRTGPNASGAVRKAYIVQFCPDGARLHAPDGAVRPVDDPGRQFPVLRGGRAVAPP